MSKTRSIRVVGSSRKAKAKRIEKKSIEKAGEFSCFRNKRSKTMTRSIRVIDIYIHTNTYRLRKLVNSPASRAGDQRS